MKVNLRAPRRHQYTTKEEIMPKGATFGTNKDHEGLLPGELSAEYHDHNSLTASPLKYTRSYPSFACNRVIMIT
jgi:hypothetical protein